MAVGAWLIPGCVMIHVTNVDVFISGHIYIYILINSPAYGYTEILNQKKDADGGELLHLAQDCKQQQQQVWPSCTSCNQPSIRGTDLLVVKARCLPQRR